MTVTLIACQADAALAPPKGTEPKDAELAIVTQGIDAPEMHLNDETSLPKGEPEEKSMPPNLEAFISGECLPDNLDVYITPGTYDKYIPGLDVGGPWRRFIEQRPVRFVRKYPQRTPADTGNGSQPSDTTGQLDFRGSKFLGVGHHSYVILAPLTVPSTGPAPPTRGAVAVKIPERSHSQREMLLNEAKIYDAFPRELQEGTPYAPPIVPKFYGYYVPSLEAFDSYAHDDGFTKEERKDLRNMLLTIPAVLLLEACGNPISARDLSPTNREKIVMLLHRLHAAGFVQGSFFERNILEQPGPLTSPPTERSRAEASYRIIDFGRGNCPSVNCGSIESWVDAAECERELAHRELGYSYRYR